MPRRRLWSPPGSGQPLPAKHRLLEVADRYHAGHTAMVKDYRRYLTTERRPAGQRGGRVAGRGLVGGRGGKSSVILLA